jgi:phage-related protein (TIGR01555 family)
MSGVRVVNVRPKPGFTFDAARVDVIASNVVHLPIADNLINAMSGTGTGRDVRSAYAYTSRPLTQHEIASAYSGSGLMRKVVQIPALDMVREWRDWTGLDDKQTAAVWDEERRLGLRQKVRQAEVLRGMGGGALIMGLPGNPSTPAPESVTTGQLAFIHVVSRWHLSFDALQDDATQPGYGEPAMWRMNTVAGQQPIHPSRIVPFRADTSASLAMPSTWGADDAFWGESRVQQVLDAVKDSDAARAAFAALLHKARLLRLGIPGLMDTIASGRTADIQARLAAVVLAESIHNATIYDAGDQEGKGGEKIDDATYNFAGAKDLLYAYAEFVAAISDIPATRLLGRAPEGLNSSGDSQQADWNKKIRAEQTLEVEPCLARVDGYLVQSATGGSIKTAAFDWAPLDTPSQKEDAERFKTQMEAVDKLINTGTIPDRAMARGVQSLMIEEGYLPELEAALAEMPDDEKYGIEGEVEEPEGGDPTSAGEGGEGLEAKPPRRAANDAKPRTLYVSRKVKNVADLKAWAKAQGLPALDDDLHVTIAYSTKSVDWIEMGASWGDYTGKGDGEMVIVAGGPRVVEPLGDRTAVLMFASSDLSWRNREMREKGASWDWPDYQPHISLTGEPVDLSKVEPYRGKIVLGPEIFEEIKA